MRGVEMPAPAVRALPGGREVRATVAERRAPEDRAPRRYVDVQVFARDGLGGTKGVGSPFAIRSDALRATIEALEEIEARLWGNPVTRTEIP